MKNESSENKNKNKRKVEYPFGGSVAMPLGFLDAVFVGLVGLIVRCVILRLCHLCNKIEQNERTMRRERIEQSAKLEEFVTEIEDTNRREGEGAVRPARVFWEVALNILPLIETKPFRRFCTTCN